MESYYATEYLLKQRQQEIEQQARQAWKWLSLSSKRNRAHEESKRESTMQSTVASSESIDSSRT